MSGLQLRRAENTEHASAGVEERHRVDVAAPFFELEALGREACVVGDSAVVKKRPLREPGRTGGVLDLDRVVRGHFGQLSVGVTRVEERGPLVEGDRLTKMRKLRGDFSKRGLHRVAARARQVEDARGLGLSQHVGQLLGLVCRVHRHQNDTGEPGPELQQYPLREVGGPHCYSLSFVEATHEGASHLFRVAEELAEGPASPGLRICDAFDESQAVRCVGSRMAKHGSNRRCEHR